MAQASFVNGSTLTFMGSPVLTTSNVRADRVYITSTAWLNAPYEPGDWLQLGGIPAGQLAWSPNVHRWLDKDLLMDDGL